MSDKITIKECEILMHTLGLNNSKESYRNYFESGEGHHDQPTIESLVAKGFMAEAKFSRHWYYVTKAGKELLGVKR